MMTLDELLWKVNDNTIVKIYSSEEPGEEIACYDGKQSIPENMNECNVIDIYPDNNTLCIVIDL